MDGQDFASVVRGGISEVMRASEWYELLRAIRPVIECMEEQRSSTDENDTALPGLIVSLLAAFDDAKIRVSAKGLGTKPADILIDYRKRITAMQDALLISEAAMS